MSIVTMFEQVRLTATPLVVVRTADPAACRVRLTRAATNVSGDAPPAVLTWDIIRGIVALTDSAKALVPGGTNPVPPAALLRHLDAMSRDSAVHDVLIFALNLHLFWSKDPTVVQGVWNLRDVFKAQGHTLTMLVPDGAPIPAEIRDDVTVLDDPRPDADELREIILSQFKALRDTSDRKVSDPKPAALARAVTAVSGLPAFGSEQAVALSMTSKGLDMAALWDRKVAALEEIPGVEIWRGDESFDDLRGLDSLRGYCEDLVAGEPTNLVVFLDEIEKQFGNVGSALDSGASKGQFGQVLSYMEDSKVDGLMLVGPPGTGKSHVAKAMGKLAGSLVMALNFSKAKGSLVGQTEANTAAILKTIKAVARGGVLFVATSNDIKALPPELLARFTLGTYFVERARTDAERTDQWEVQKAAFGLKDPTRPQVNDESWSGRDIRNCCFTPDHKLFGEDLRWRPAGSFGVGDIVLGFDEERSWRKYRPAIIQGVEYATEPIVELTLESGKTFRLTPDHRVLRTGWRSGHKMQWKRADTLTEKDWIPRFLQVCHEEESRDAGWLAGMLDGEGSYDRGVVSIAQNPGSVLDKIELLATRFGFAYTKQFAYGVSASRTGRVCRKLLFLGGLASTCTLLGRLRPERLISKIRFADFGRMEARLGVDRVSGVKPAGRATIIKIQTSTRTLIVDGYPHHNCRLAKRMKKSIADVGGRIVPSEQVDREKIETLRAHAEGRYLDAGREGLYRNVVVNVPAEIVGTRQIRTRES